MNSNTYSYCYNNTVGNVKTSLGLTGDVEANMHFMTTAPSSGHYYQQMLLEPNVGTYQQLPVACNYDQQYFPSVEGYYAPQDNTIQWSSYDQSEHLFTSVPAEDTYYQSQPPHSHSHLQHLQHHHQQQHQQQQQQQLLQSQQPYHSQQNPTTRPNHHQGSIFTSIQQDRTPWMTSRSEGPTMTSRLPTNNTVNFPSIQSHAHVGNGTNYVAGPRMVGPLLTAPVSHPNVYIMGGKSPSSVQQRPATSSAVAKATSRTQRKLFLQHHEKQQGQQKMTGTDATHTSSSHSHPYNRLSKITASGEAHTLSQLIRLKDEPKPQQPKSIPPSTFAAAVDNDYNIAPSQPAQLIQPKSLPTPTSTAQNLSPVKTSGLTPPPNITLPAKKDEQDADAIKRKLKEMQIYKDSIKLYMEVLTKNLGSKTSGGVPASTVSSTKYVYDILDKQISEGVTMRLLERLEQNCKVVQQRTAPELMVRDFAKTLEKAASKVEKTSGANNFEAFNTTINKAFGCVVSTNAGSDTEGAIDLGDEWNELLAKNKKLPMVVGDQLPDLFPEFSHLLSRPAQRELFVLSKRYSLTLGQDKHLLAIKTMTDPNVRHVWIDASATDALLIENGVPFVSLLIPVDYPESEEMPSLFFEPVADYDKRLSAIKRNFVDLLKSIDPMLASHSNGSRFQSPINIIQLVSLLEAAALSHQAYSY